MVTLHDSLLSSSARPLPIRKRPDLVARRQHYLGRTYWVVKDPVGLHYFRFQEEEYAILQMLDGEDQPGRDQGAIRSTSFRRRRSRSTSCSSSWACCTAAGWWWPTCPARAGNSASAATNANASSCCTPWATSSASASRASIPSGC